MIQKNTNLVIYTFSILFFIQLSCIGLSHASDRSKTNKHQGDKERSSPQISQLELQSELMSFADRFASILGGAYQSFVRQNPKYGTQFIAQENGINALLAAYTIAAEPNPSVALLDMTIMVTLGRMVYEDRYLQNLEEDIKGILESFKKLEQDIWRITAKLLVPEEQERLRQGIIDWRKANPGQIQFSYLRFENFASSRMISSIVSEIDSRGVFGSIKKATTEAERVRLIAERGMFLASRLLFLSGYFSEVWLQNLIMNPELQEIKNDFHTFSLSSKRLVEFAESLPSHLEANSKVLISKLEAKEVKNFFNEVQDTITIADDLSKSVDKTLNMADALVGKLPIYVDKLEFERAIIQINRTVQDINTTLMIVDNLLSSPNFGKMLNLFIDLFDRYEYDPKKLIVHFMVSLGGLILLFFFCLFILRYADKKFITK